MIAFIPFFALGGIAAVMADASGEPSPEMAGGLLLGMGLSMLAVIGLLIYNLMLLHKSAQTIGKKILGIKITRQDGSRAGLGRIFGLRIVVPQLIGMIPFVGGLISLVGILLIFRDDRRCLHDMIADTIVVKS